MKKTMYVYEFQVWAILLALILFEFLDSATTWFYMRLTGKSFRVVEKTPLVKKIGLGRSTILGLLATTVGTAYFLFLFPSWIFQSSPVAEILVLVLFLVSYHVKFGVVISNFRKIRKFMGKEKKKIEEAVR